MAGKYPNGKGKPKRKPKFRPEITRVRLNPEQAVLQCTCHDQGYFLESVAPGTGSSFAIGEPYCGGAGGKYKLHTTGVGDYSGVFQNSVS